MSVQSIYSNITAANVNTTGKISEKTAETTAAPSGTTNSGFDETAAVYEKTSETETSSPTANKNAGIDRDAIIAQMKADVDARMNQLTSIVQEMMLGQGKSYSFAAGDDSIWKFLASGEYTVTEAAKLQAQEDIAENGYWGVEQTSDRILDFAKALAGNDVSKADELFEAFKKGYSEATKSWGRDLPDISKQTYDAVEKKFEAWKKEATQTPTDTPADTAAEDMNV